MDQQFTNGIWALDASKLIDRDNFKASINLINNLIKSGIKFSHIS